MALLVTAFDCLAPTIQNEEFANKVTAFVVINSTPEESENIVPTGII